MLSEKPTILLLGKLPPPYMGPAIATKIILNSKLNNEFKLIHFNTKINQSISGIGKLSLSKMLNMLSLYLNYNKALANSKPEVVLIPISQTTIGFLKDAVFILLAKSKGRKVVIQLRGSNLLNWFKTTYGFTKRFVERYIKKSDGAIVLGPNLKYLFEPFLDAQKIFVVPNGANFNTEFESENHEKIRVLYLANFIESKGFFDVLRAIKMIQETEANFEFIAAGSWMQESFRTKCESFISANNLSIKFQGSVDEKGKAELLSKADIFLFTPNEPEGHPWVLVEASAFSLPIISTDQGAIINNVEDQKNGFIVSEHSPVQIVDRLLKLQDDSLREQMGKASRLIYQEKFTEDIMVENLSVMFRSVLDQ